MKLNVLALGIACGILWGVGLFLMTWWIIMFDGTLTDPTFLGRLYRGYSISPEGSVVGLIWGLVDGFIGGAIIAWSYNFIFERLDAATASTKNK